jgi:Peptidase family S41
VALLKPQKQLYLIRQKYAHNYIMSINLQTPFNLRSLLIVILFIIIQSCDKTDIINDPDYNYTVEELQEDFEKFKNKLLHNHPGLAEYSIRSRFDQFAADASSQITSPLNSRDFYYLISTVAEKANCGHTRLYMPDAYWENMNAKQKFFPLKLYYSDSSAFVIKNYSNNTTITPGCEVISINSIPMTEIISNYISAFGSDGFNQTYKYYKMNEKRYGLFPAYTEYPDSYTLDLKSATEDTTASVTIMALSSKVISEHELYNEINYEEYYPYDLVLIDSLNTAFLTIETFVVEPGWDYKDFYKSAFDSIRKNNIGNLIIDVRLNDGGDPNPAAELISYILDSAYIYFPPNVIGYNNLKKSIKQKQPDFSGNLYVLIDGGCFSTTGHFLSILRYHNRGILIGEESGGSFWCYGCVNEFTLPNTGIMIQYPRCIFQTAVNRFSFDHGIIPDYEVKPEVKDLVNGDDTVLKFTLNLINVK